MEQMKRLKAILLLALSLLIAGCSGNSFKDIKVKDFDIVSAQPVGLSAIDATVKVTVKNPTIGFVLDNTVGTIKIEGEPCLVLTAPRVMIDGKCEKTYEIPVHGRLGDSFNPFQLVDILQKKDFSHCTLDVVTDASLKSGIGKKLEYKDLPLSQFLD